MARTIAQIQKAIWDRVLADSDLAPALTSSSVTAIWWLWSWVVATSQQQGEDAYDKLREEVAATIATQKPHTKQWYVTIAKAFQFGDSLPVDSDVYDPVKDVTDVSRIVTFASVVEFSNLLRLKVAKGTVGALGALSGPELTALAAYMNTVKDAGVRVQCTSGAADNLQLKVNVYYDPLVLDATGARLDGTSATPVKDAINNFLDSLPFNGVFKLNALIDAMQAVSGVTIAEPLVCQANYAAVPYTNIIAATPNTYTPDAGYMALDVAYFNAQVSYVAYL